MKLAVLGAGLMGRLLALALRRQGHRVTLFDQGGPDAQGSAARVAAAMLAPVAESVDAEPLVVGLGEASLSLWQALIASLKHPVFFQQQGTLVLWHGQDREEARLFEERLRRDSPINHPKRPLKLLTAAELAALEPSLAGRFQKGLFLPEEGQLDNRQLLDALLHALVDEGVSCQWNQSVTPDAVQADFVFDARGLGSKAEWPSLRGVRGEVIRVQAPEVRLTRPVRLLHPRYPIYIAPKPERIFVVGATQIETEDRSPMSVRSALELLSALYTVDPAFGEARILELLSQCRPALPDHRPVIRWNGGQLIEVNGLYRHGFLVAPAVRDGALALLEAVGDPPLDLHRWREQQPFPDLYQLNLAA